ncbi:MAG: AraC family transcriptional regulator [Planctomycetota bacterium]|nr:MAG: AraC family transcriptional regulator [Planctomycetota bacterium]
MSRPKPRSHVRVQSARRRATAGSGESVGIRKEFFERMGGPQQFQQLFEHLPGVSFFVKDRQSRMICASQPFWEHLGAKSEAEIVGKTDDDFFPPHAADHFKRDDQLVMTTGRPLIGRVELWYNEQRVLDWFVTNKLPVRDTRGEVIGVTDVADQFDGRFHSRASPPPPDGRRPRQPCWPVAPATASQVSRSLWAERARLPHQDSHPSRQRRAAAFRFDHRSDRDGLWFLRPKCIHTALSQAHRPDAAEVSKTVCGNSGFHSLLSGTRQRPR